MRILHTADWHIGCRTDGLLRLDEQKQVLNEIGEKRKLTFIEIKVAMESRADLGRPKETAAENKDNFMRYHGVKG